MGNKKQNNSLFDNLDSFNKTVRKLLSDADDNFDYSVVVLMAGKQCEAILQKIIENEGLPIDERGLVDVSDDKRFPHQHQMTALSYGAMSPNLLPPEMRELVNFIRRGRNVASHHTSTMTKEQAEEFMQAFNAFSTWYYIHYRVYKSDQNARLAAYASMLNIHVKPKEESEEKISEESAAQIEQAAKSTVEETISRIVRAEVQKGVSEINDVVRTEAGEIKGKIDELSALVISLSEKIGDYQSLVEKQLEMATSPEEQEHIIHAFTEECVSKMEARFEKNEADKNYKRNLNDLKETLGEVCWNRLDPRSRTFLISSRIMYDELIVLEDIIDYSGVCILVTKALEYELSKRFYTKYLKYLKEEYGKDYSKYPSTMLKTYNGTVSVIQKTDFTLGSVAYIFCIKPELKPGNDTTQRDKDKGILLDFAEKKIYKDTPRDEIESQLDSYARDVDEVKSKFRNKSAHTNELKKSNAKECFDIVLDVQKLLRKMIESFDNTDE